MDEINTSEQNTELKTLLNPPSLSTARNNLVVNFLSNLIYQGVATVVSLWMTPFLISYLGISAFGMIPLTNTVASYLSLFTTSINLAVSRFLAIELGQSDNEAANKTFNTALFCFIGIIVALTPIAIIIAIFFSSLFQVPPGLETDSSWLFAIVVGTFFTTIISGVFSLSPFIHSRFIASNFVNLVSLMCRVGFILVAFNMFQAHLWYAGGGMLVGAFVSIIGYFILWRKLTPQLHIRLPDFDYKKLTSLSGLGGWSLVNSVGGLLLDRVDLLVVNAYYGPAVTGDYGAIVQLSVLIDILMMAASSVIRPIILLKYSQNDFHSLRSLALQAVKLIGLALALPVGLMCGLSKPLLSSWLGPSFTHLNILLIIVVGHLGVNLSIRPLLYIHNAYNKVKWPGIVTLICGGVSAAASIILARLGLWGYIGIAGSTAVIWIVKNAFFMTIYTSHIMKQPWWTFIPSLRWSIIGTLFVGMISYGFTLLYMPSNLLTLAISAILISLLYAIVLWSIGFNYSDKQLIKDLLPLNKFTRINDPLKGLSKYK